MSSTLVTLHISGLLLMFKIQTKIKFSLRLPLENEKWIGSLPKNKISYLVLKKFQRYVIFISINITKQTREWSLFDATNYSHPCRSWLIEATYLRFVRSV